MTDTIARPTFCPFCGVSLGEANVKETGVPWAYRWSVECAGCGQHEIALDREAFIAMGRRAGYDPDPRDPWAAWIEGCEQPPPNIDL